METRQRTRKVNRPTYPRRSTQPPTPETWRRAAGRLRKFADQIEARSTTPERLGGTLARAHAYLGTLRDRHDGAHGMGYCPKCACVRPLKYDRGDMLCGRCNLVL